MSEEKKNLKGRKGDLFYYRWVKTGKKKPVQRIRRGKEEVYFQEILEKVYFQEKDVKAFSLEKYGQPLPRTHGNVTILDNYFLDYWGHFLGTGGTTAFAHLLRFCYGDKEYCYPELGLIEAKMNVSRPTLRGYLDKLEEHGFLVRFWVQNPSKKNLDESAIYKIRRTIPFLSQELIEQLLSFSKLHIHVPVLT
ncbi:helix-turn-helix domain-containing protein [Aneurinibacillus aneurinilyticus]|jgi:hypothetical protein|uniref:helix-turn-helix domain-containing protein n=1 Tax=Aneurinibacillus aneurinilyticus TaxID=1391 RepID=UPI0023F9CF2B|nr:helix-turn-helix domain-containing protein [Aneurinibacillus aneurinilyticus]MCI1696372.1 helix-turn-helix domain-containing protein [Aneurinibacillus aneurinilyticus]